MNVAGPRSTPVRPGPKIKPLLERISPHLPPVKRKRVGYGRRRRTDVLVWLANYRIEETLTYDPAIERPPRKHRSIQGPDATVDREDILGVIHRTRPPTLLEASERFKIPLTTLGDWWANRDRFLEARKHAMNGRWPVLEAALFEQFLARRSRLALVNARWIKRTAERLWAELYPEEAAEKPFTFSLGWFSGFKKRYRIVPRRITKKATKLPKDYLEAAQRFLGFGRNWMKPQRPFLNPRDNIELCSSPTRPDELTRRFPRRLVLNLDETPAPFEFLEGSTYQSKGSKTVAAHSSRSGWDKRQATVVLLIFADGGVGPDGKPRVKPLIIFKGDPTDKKGMQAAERPKYDNRVEVAFNKHAYNNEELFLWWLEEHVIPTFGGEPAFLVMDVASFHYTDKIRDLLVRHGVVVALIPAGCTSLLQPLDTAINKPFKDWLKAETERLEDEKRSHLPPGEEPVWTTAERRIMLTVAVGAAATQLASEHGQALVTKAFTDIGITVRPDGSEDNNIRLKDIDATDLDISRYTQIVSDEFHSDEMPEIFLAKQYIHQGEDIPAHLDRLKATTLKDMLKRRGLGVSGNKKALIERLRADDEIRADAAFFADNDEEDCDGDIDDDALYLSFTTDIFPRSV